MHDELIKVLKGAYDKLKDKVDTEMNMYDDDGSSCSSESSKIGDNGEADENKEEEEDTDEIITETKLTTPETPTAKNDNKDNTADKEVKMYQQYSFTLHIRYTKSCHLFIN